LFSPGSPCLQKARRRHFLLGRPEVGEVECTNWKDAGWAATVVLHGLKLRFVGPVVPMLLKLRIPRRGRRQSCHLNHALGASVLKVSCQCRISNAPFPGGRLLYFGTSLSPTIAASWVSNCAGPVKSCMLQPQTFDAGPRRYPDSWVLVLSGMSPAAQAVGSCSMIPRQGACQKPPRIPYTRRRKKKNITSHLWS
jgi:hypothetical protein